MTIHRSVQKRIAEIVLALPALVYLGLIYFCGLYDLPNWRLVLVHTGFIACGLFVFLLLLNPVKRLWSNLSFVYFFNKFRRQIGVAIFGYAVLHYIAVIMKQICKTGGFWPSYLLKVVPFTGFLAFLLLFLLAITSNDYSVRKMGIKRWKQLHLWAYVIEGLVMLHLLLQGGQTAFLACIIFIPLMAIQLYSRKQSL